MCKKSCKFARKFVYYDEEDSLLYGADSALWIARQGAAIA